MVAEQTAAEEQEVTQAPAEEAKAEENNKGASSLSEKLQGILEQIKQLTVLELADFVKALEEEFGVSAAAAVAVAAPGAAAGGGAAPVEEKDEFDVILTEAGAKKIQVIKEIRAITSLGLKEAKDMVEGAPKTVKDGVKKDEAEKLKKQLEEAGAKVEIK